ncbi:hypothetical protein A1O7_05243 [Cladophialophora yegresii CBS 114405]|uniref:FAD-binding FR-type domain-containing protein n=1 Tax=Cladophialophora yegresii CBS 114405 TaxID=1182544 RepID=W9W7X0_9EURO|nr:uncharacterized protein A1O7_05243 [Cladophialophora yegresii CBS 114405]EXJ61090.1 hypothetical protein A1O7_05243 [Cladophialophora yegresii CBS 114405]
MTASAVPPLPTLESHQHHIRLDGDGDDVVTKDRGLQSELSDDPNYCISQIDEERPTTSSAADSDLAQHNTPVAHDQGSSRSGSLILEKNPLPGMQMPDKKYTRPLRNLRWTIFSVYRRLNALILTANIIAIIILAAQHKLVSMSPERAASAVSINLTVSVLMRQELVINTLFWVFGKCPQWFPLRIRRLSAKIYHLGGVHSGAAMSATVWFAFFNVSIVNSFQSGRIRRHQSSIPIITVLLDVLLLSIIAMAHPAIRARMHNQFELVHRFAGWTATALFWVEFAFLTDAKVHDVYSPEPASLVVVRSPIFWTLLIATISIALPWVWLRKVKVNAEHLSDHAIRLHFTYTKLPLCAAPRISDSPLLEWHAFAGIPHDEGPGFSVLVSKAGDWTSRLIRSPPTSLWVRGIPTLGVLHVAPIFRKLVLVATGSGIGPILSLLSQSDVCCRILWSTPTPEVTYSKNVVDTVLRADPEAMIINTTVSGRPDLVKHTYELYVKSAAEAVFVISNPRVTRRVVYSLESRGIPVFAP